MAFQGAKAQADSEIYKAFKSVLERKKVPLLSLKKGDKISGFGDAGLSILHPPEDYTPLLHADNNRSLVTGVSYGKFFMVLPGDLEKDGLQRLLENRGSFPKAVWLMAPHHGRASGEPSLCEEGFRPRFIVFSDWKDYPDSRRDYESPPNGGSVLATSEVGAIELEVGLSGKGRYRCFREGVWHKFKAGE
jgi:hypothetical protein